MPRRPLVVPKFSPAGDLPTPPPDSPRRRRRILRESEESDGEMSIEQYLYASDGFRSTTSTSKLPHPLDESPVSESLKEQWESAKASLLPLIGEILESECGMRKGRWGVKLVNYSKPGYHSKTSHDRHDPTLVINSEESTSQGRPRNWSLARVQVKSLLTSREIGVDVEILSQKGKLERCLFALQPEDEVVGIYNKVRHRLLEIVQEHLPTSWRMLCIWSIGSQKDKAEPAVVIFVDPGTIKDWNTLMVNLKSIINMAIPPKSSVAIEVEFLPGGTGFLEYESSDDEEQDGDEIEDDEGKGMPGINLASQLSKTPWMGMSIGVDGEQGGGTLGGFVELNVAGTMHRGFLTNWHVVQPPRSAAASTRKASVRHGTNYYCSSDPTRVGVHYLATKDVQSTKEGLGSALTEATKGLQHEEADNNTRVLCGAKPSRGHTMRREIRLQDIADCQEKLSLMDTLPASIGRVIASSGRSTAEREGLAHIIDWAFVEVEKTSSHLVGQNKLPLKSEILDPQVWGIAERLVVPEVATDFGKLEGGRFYYKVGRTTGLTCSICHAVQAYVPGEHIRYDDKGRCVRVRDKGKATLEWILVGGPDAEKKQSSVCQPGDSGAFIIDSEGKVSGLMYGNLQNYCGPQDHRKCYVCAGLATSMDIVIDAIQARTAKKDEEGQITGPGGTIELV